MSSADENELIQGLVDMAEAYWDERTALRARVAELEAELKQWKRYHSTERTTLDGVLAERDKLAAVVERVRELANVRGGYSAAYDLALDILAELPPKEDA